MIVSHNELVAVVNKAFLGMRRTCGEADVIANMVADLQMVGLNGISHFNNALRFLGHEQDCPVDIKLTEPGQIHVDLHDCSLACHLPVIIDYALEQMAEHKHLTIHLSQCHNRWLGYSELVNLAAKGIACKAKWTNGSSPEHTLYVLNKGRIYPELFLSDSNELEAKDLHDMTIELAVQDFDIPALASDYSTHIDSVILSDAQELAWRNGISVDDRDWEVLKQAATAILVENSAQSVRGAGELVE